MSKKTKVPRTVAELIALLQKYPGSRRLGSYTIEVKTANPCICEVVAERDAFNDDSEAWLP